MAARKVKLLGAWVSPFALRSRIALNLKSVEHEFLEENLGSKSDLLLKSNPVYKKVPVLLHGDRPVCESLIIVEYIDETWTSGPSILPSDPYDRATARFWAYYIDDKFCPSLVGISKAEGPEAKAEAIEQAKTGLELLEKAFKDCSKGGAFFNGDQIGYLDIAFGCCIGWIRATESMHEIKLFDEEKTPGLVGWIERFCAHKAVKDVMHETEKLIEFAKTLLSKPPPTH
ncbi:hypothetical protein Scep_017583 [Stephania cephalantha]|uniref:Glutathione S-transferase n=1 Tax=Stephania cephalantha TaxID=152367 RepID=A0AAP0IQQ6_9MAGN